MGNKSVTIELFKEVFLSEITQDGKYIDYISSRDFTEKVKLAMKKIGEKSLTQYASEYYTVDYSFWDDNSNEEAVNATKVKMKSWKWNLLALVEHENDNNDWNYEVIKLAPFKCPLRIVVGYRNEKIPDEVRLRYVEGLLKDMNKNECFCEEGEFWIVIGNCGHGDADYRFYKYNAIKKIFE